MWAIADAAMREKPERYMTFVVGARSVESLYIIPALCQLATFSNVNIVPVVAEPQNLTKAIREGRPTDHLPKLSERDVVYAAGAPAMVQSVADIAEAANAKCYMDPFRQLGRRRRQRIPVARLQLVQRYCAWVRLAHPGRAAGALPNL
jgi:3-phenylpropionate/trans-cinnamate dioxygenase ferredoxin reductase subunit